MTDYQFESGSLTVGRGCDIRLAPPGPTGLGRAPMRTVDVDRIDDDGAAAGLDTAPTQQITIPVKTLAAPSIAAQRILEELPGAWPAGVDNTLTARLPGWERTWFGRFRSIETDLTLLSVGDARALVTFDALDPKGYAAAVDVTAGTSITLTNSGSRWTSRCELTIVGNGGTPLVVNTDDDGGAIAWSIPLGVGETRVIDLRRFTVVDDADVDCGAEITTGSTWFVIRPGANDLTLTGAASIAATFRPAYL